MAQPALSAAAGQSEPAIDRDHLSRMTLGDRGLEREVLQLFDRQAELLVARMRTAEPDALSALAHALKGSARGIGAFAVALAAEAIERPAAHAAADNAAALDRLAAAVAEVRLLIAQVLRAG